MVTKADEERPVTLDDYISVQLKSDGSQASTSIRARNNRDDEHQGQGSTAAAHVPETIVPETIIPSGGGLTDDTRAEETGGPDEIWSRQTVLSLDGGGIRGYWSLLVLQTLMSYIAIEEMSLDEKCDNSFFPGAYQENVCQSPSYEPDPTSQGPERGSENRSLDRPEEGGEDGDEDLGDQDQSGQLDEKVSKFLPVHYFDLMVGSSTGALIALMLGRFRMPVSECLYEYRTMATKIFGNPRITLRDTFPVVRNSKYDPLQVKRAYQDLCRRRQRKDGSVNNVRMGTARGACKVCITSSRLFEKDSVAEDVPIRSYPIAEDHSSNLSRDDVYREFKRDSPETEVSLAAQAATAAVPLFERVMIPLRAGNLVLVDGGMGRLNNPVQLAIIEAERLGTIDTLISIGTARKDPPMTSGPLALIRQARWMVYKGTDPEGAHDEVANRRKQWNYVRFNNPGVSSIPMDEWKPRRTPRWVRRRRPPGHKTIAKIKKNFDDWLSVTDGLQAEFQQYAKLLVAKRRQRMRHERWEQYSKASHYVCQDLGKDHGCGGRRFEYAEDFSRHLKDQHSVWSKEDLDECMNRGRRYWEYPPRTFYGYWP